MEKTIDTVKGEAKKSTTYILLPNFSFVASSGHQMVEVKNDGQTAKRLMKAHILVLLQIGFRRRLKDRW